MQWRNYQLFQNAFSLESIDNVNSVVDPSHFSITLGLALYFSFPTTKAVTSPVFNYFSNGKLNWSTNTILPHVRYNLT